SVNSWKIDDVRCVLGRRGSPLRIAHIHYLQSALHQVTATERKHGLLNLLASQFNRDPEMLTSKSLRDDLLPTLRRAALLCAEMRVVGLNISLRTVNWDLFRRVCGVAEMRISLHHIDLKATHGSGEPGVECTVD